MLKEQLQKMRRYCDMNRNTATQQTTTIIPVIEWLGIHKKNEKNIKNALVWYNRKKKEIHQIQ